jgi:NAD(P)-dependent dehydrogenase (short-subunit alcohol dehydrogenase family)
MSQKIAYVTGGMGGIGTSICRRLSKAGFTVIAGCGPTRDYQKWLDEQKALGYDFHASAGNVADWQSTVDAFAKAKAAYGPIDVLVNNAGINIREPIEEMKGENLDRMLAVNVRGPFLGIKHFIPLLRKSGGGSIINMSSVCGLVGHRYTTEAYTLTKGAVTMLTKAIAVRYATDNIRCNAICPSTVDTPLVREMLKDPARRSERLGEVPLGRLATEADVANAALFLSSDEASFLNGIALPVDGGTVAD